MIKENVICFVFADLIDSKDPQGRTFREVNRAIKHSIPIGALVELESGARLFVMKHTRDCDGTPMYSLGLYDDMDWQWSHGHPEYWLTVVALPLETKGELT